MLHTAEAHLGQTISEKETREGKLTKLLIKEDYDVPS